MVKSRGGAVANRLRRRVRIKRSSVRIRPWPLRWVLGQGSLLPLSQGEAFTLASISYLAILVKYIPAKKKKKIWLHIWSTVQQKIFVSEKFRQKRPSGSSSGIYFRQTSDRSFCLRSFGSLAYRLSSHSWVFLITHLSFCGKFSQEFNLVKKLLWRKRRN